MSATVARPRTPPARLRPRLARLADEVPSREWLMLGVAMALGLGLRLAYVIVTHGHTLTGDEPSYSQAGAFIAHGRWFWGTTPYGIAHATAWKAPGYPLWVGFWYTILGVHPDRLFAVQAFLGPVNIGLAWLLARRLVGPRAALITAFVMAVYPDVWQFEERMYSEAIATPLTLVALLMVIERNVTVRRALAVGLLLGVLVLIRPSSVVLLPGVALAWWTGSGPRRGTAVLALTIACAGLLVAPWTIRNALVLHGFIPVSVQDAAAYGTFNPTAAMDPMYPWAWRPLNPRDADLFDPRHPLPEPTLEHDLENRALHYIEAHPSSLLKAFYWNGLVRTWDLQSPYSALWEVPYEGRTRTVALVGLFMYDVLLPLAVLGLWLLRRRRGVWLPVLGIALSVAVVFTADGGTRYRATVEPLVVVLAGAALAWLWDLARQRLRGKPLTAPPSPGASA